MKELEKRYRKKNAIGAIATLIIGLVISFFVFKDYLPIGNVQDLDFCDVSTITEGRGKVTIYDVYDYYSYWTDSYGKEVTRDYFVAVGDQEEAVYIGCELTGNKNKKAYEIMEALWDVEDESDFENLDLDYFTVRGTIKPIEGEDLKYFNDYLADLSEYYGMDMEEVNEHFLPYVLVGAKIGDGDTYGYVFAFLGIGLIVCAIGMMFCALFADPLKGVKEYCKKTGNPEYEMTKIENFYNSTAERYGTRINDTYFLFTGGGKPEICSTEDVLWFYQYIVTRKSNFVTVGKDYYVRFRLANGKMVQTAAKKETVNDVLNYFMRMLPDSIVGYSDQLEKLYKKNRQDMIDEVERRHHERNGMACMHDDNENYEEREMYDYNS